MFEELFQPVRWIPRLKRTIATGIALSTGRHGRCAMALDSLSPVNPSFLVIPMCRSPRACWEEVGIIIMPDLLSSPRILLVDDEVEPLQLCAQVIKMCGFRVVTANRPMDAICIMTEKPSRRN